jgi:hypothetical protein
LAAAALAGAFFAAAALAGALAAALAGALAAALAGALAVAFAVVAFAATAGFFAASFLGFVTTLVLLTVALAMLGPPQRAEVNHIIFKRQEPLAGIPPFNASFCVNLR